MRFDYYGNVKRVLLELKTNKSILSNYKSELRHLVKMQGPLNVKGVSYDQPSVQSDSSKKTDLEILTRISSLINSIAVYEKIVFEKEETLTELKKLGQKYLTNLEERGKEDLKLRVFIAGYIEGKSNNQIQEEITGYEMKTIWNIKSEINKYLNDNLES